VTITQAEQDQFQHTRHLTTDFSARVKAEHPEV